MRRAVGYFAAARMFRPTPRTASHRLLRNSTLSSSCAGPSVLSHVSTRHLAPTSKSRPVIFLQTLCRRQRIHLICYQANPDSFCRTPGVGAPRKTAPLESVTSGLFFPTRFASWLPHSACRCLGRSGLRVTPLESALTPNALLTPLESALTKNTRGVGGHLQFSNGHTARFITYLGWRGWRVALTR